MATKDNLLSSASWNSGASRTTVGWEFTYDETEVVIPAEGVTGPSEAGVQREDAILTVDYLEPSPDTPNAAPQTFVIVMKRTDGTNRTYTFASMKPRGYSIAFHRGDETTVYRQKYRYIGDSVSGCLTIS